MEQKRQCITNKGTPPIKRTLTNQENTIFSKWLINKRMEHDVNRKFLYIKLSRKLLGIVKTILHYTMTQLAILLTLPHTKHSTTFFIFTFTKSPIMHNIYIFTRYTLCSKKVIHRLKSILNVLSKFFHWHTLRKIRDKTVIKNPTTS